MTNNITYNSVKSFSKIVWNYMKMDKILNGKTAKDYEDNICVVCQKEFNDDHYYEAGAICDDCLKRLANIS